MKLSERLQSTVRLLRLRGGGVHAGWVEEAIRELEEIENLVPRSPSGASSSPGKILGINVSESVGEGDELDNGTGGGSDAD